jgi:hypothetical protein
MFDPPDGWRFGFPQPLPKPRTEFTQKEFEDWVISKGYPRSFIDNGMLTWSRYFEADIEDD